MSNIKIETMETRLLLNLVNYILNNEEIKKLEEEKIDHVLAQNYAKAASIRDRISELDKKTPSVEIIRDLQKLIEQRP